DPLLRAVKYRAARLPTTQGDHQHMSTNRPAVDEQRWKAIRAHIAKGDKTKAKADDPYIAAGRYLGELRAKHTGTWADWEALVKEKAGIGKSRASELMAIAAGTKTVEQVRAETSERTAKTRALQSSPLRSGEDDDEDDDEASASHDGI